MRTRFYILLITFLIVSLYVKGQDTLYFKFSVENHLGNDTIRYYGMEYEFTSVRVHLREGTFVEYNLLSRQTADTFKKKDSNWYIRRKGKWEYFFSVEGFDSKNRSAVNIAGLEYYLTPGRKIKVKKRQLYELVAVPKDKAIQVSDLPKYIFDNEDGIVEIISSEVNLVRRKQNTVSNK